MSSMQAMHPPDRASWQKFTESRHAALGFSSRLQMVDGEEGASATVTAWAKGRAAPPPTDRAIQRASEYLHASPQAVVAILWPKIPGSAEEVVAAVRNARRLVVTGRENARRRAKWAVAPESRVKPAHLKKPRRLKWEAFHALTGDDRAQALATTRAQHRHARVARERSAVGDHSRAEFWAVCKAYGYRCAYCGVKRTKKGPAPVILTADHLIPLSRGGSNFIANIVPARFSCNSSKQAADLISWAMHRGLALDWRVLTQYDQLTKAKHA
jgi:hypothetical protein